MADHLEHDVPNHRPDTGAVPVPHGPDTHTHNAYLPRLSSVSHVQEERILDCVLKPEDSYDGSVYWADLGWRQRLGFANRQFLEETRRELRHLRLLTSIRPWAPLSMFARSSVLPGAGLGLEGYILFSIGNLAPLFATKWPQCWDKHGSHAECTKNVVAMVTYLEILGIMVGQVLVGILGDKIGRRWGLVQDAIIMGFGLVLLTASWTGNLEGWVVFYAVSLFVYGVGVGGEYPMTATTSMENAVGAGTVSTREDRLHRGRKVTLAFLMQGIGQFANLLILMFLLAVSNNRSLDPPYSDTAVQVTFRVAVGIIAPPTFWLAWYRFSRMKGASRQLQLSKSASQRGGKQSVTGYNMKSIKLSFDHFGGRLVGTAGTWFCNDVFFYGNKLFVGAFINAISGGSGDASRGVALTWKWSLCNIVVSLAGYFLAAFLVDHKAYGRKRMQAFGFLACFLFVVIPSFNFEYFTSREHVNSFQAMYFLSSFFNQFGPNSVTFLAAGEVYPASVRASAHGFSACIGKLGALLSAVVFAYLTTEQSFKFCCFFALAGWVLNLIFLPDTTGLDLKEPERRWWYIEQGKGDDYWGIAVHPHHLSLWERWRGLGKQYNQEVDYRQRREDLREEWERSEAAKAGEDVPKVPWDILTDSSDEASRNQVHEYFVKNRRRWQNSEVPSPTSVAAGVPAQKEETSDTARSEVEKMTGRRAEEAEAEGEKRE